MPADPRIAAASPPAPLTPTITEPAGHMAEDAYVWV
jgi:hypothetical protein